MRKIWWFVLSVFDTLSRAYIDSKRKKITVLPGATKEIAREKRLTVELWVQKFPRKIAVTVWSLIIKYLVNTRYSVDFRSKSNSFRISWLLFKFFPLKLVTTVLHKFDYRQRGTERIYCEIIIFNFIFSIQSLPFFLSFFLSLFRVAYFSIDTLPWRHLSSLSSYIK